MITRRSLMTAAVALSSLPMIKALGLQAYGGGAIAVPPVNIYTDKIMKDFGVASAFSVGSINTLKHGAGVLSEKSIPSEALGDLAQGVAWLKATSGSPVIVAIDTRNALLFDEMVREAHVRVLYRGEHAANGLNSTAVRHSATELPVSAGVTKSLPQSGAWTAQLFAALALVANRKWSGHAGDAEATSNNSINARTAKISLATYVLEA